jgi:nucleotide-binding universal stress UspA family protein
MYTKILVAVDGSETSNRGLEEAIRLAKDQGATLYPLHVVEEFVLTQSVDAGRIALDRLLEELRRSGQEVLAGIEKKVSAAGVRCQPILEESASHRVADIVVERARELGVDLIVLGTHGRRGLRRVVLGSDAEIVLRNTPVPVLLVRAPEQ